MSYFCLVSCEHASHEIPFQYQSLFEKKENILLTHRGYDIGAKLVFDYVSKIATYACEGKYSRLLIDLNRTLNHSHLFSEFTKHLPLQEKEEIIRTVYEPYVRTMEKKIQEALHDKKKVFHLSIHSFTPVLHGEKRTNDIGFLYAPYRVQEKEFCMALKEACSKEIPDFKIRMNYPYRGTANGLTHYFRKKFPRDYVGIELEINQKLFSKEPPCSPHLLISLAQLFERQIKKGS